MSNIYIGFVLSLFVVFLAYFLLSKLLLLVICALFAGLYFKNDLIAFRYVEFHVASFYLWICENCRSIQTMYHQSNNTNYTPKYEENNGSISLKFEKLLQHRLKAKPITATNNLNSSPSCMQPQPQPLTSSTTWNSASLSSGTTSLYNRSPIMDNISRLSQHQYKVSSDLVTKAMSNVQRPSQSIVEMVDRKGESASYTFSQLNDSSRPVDWKSPKQSPALDVKLYANVNSPGFCSRVAEEINETMTHQPQYNTMGSFPCVNLNNQSQPKKIKIPVRVRLAPPTSDVSYTSIGSSSMSRSPLSGPDDSMKSVLQVLKEISRKRIHSHIDEDLEDQSKRLRYTESQYMADNTSHTSLLQQTIQGKRAREDSSPTEDVKKRRKPSVNNEISASLSSSLLMKSPQVDSAKRKRKARAVDDSVSTPALGKLLKVQREIVPPPTAVSTPVPTVQPIKEVSVDEVMIEVGPAPTTPTSTHSDDDQPSSRLLGRFSGPERPSTPVPAPATPKARDQFSAVNDLGLSPPKENRLAAMIAVLGGPADLDVLTSQKSPEKVITGKALFTTPETPETPKQNKKVTFSEHLTMTKVFEREGTDSSKSSVESTTSVPTPQVPVLNFSSAPVAPTMSSSSLTISPLGFPINSPSSTAFGGSSKQKEDASMVITSSSTVSSASQNGTIQPTLNFLSTSISSPATVSSSNAVSVSGSDSKFSFNSTSSPQSKPEETLKPIAPAANSMFSFGNVKTTESQISNAPVFGNTSTNKDTSKPTPTLGVTSSITTSNNSSFSIFTSKNSPSLAPSSKADSQKPIVNGLPETNVASPFASLQKLEESKTTCPFVPLQKPETTKSTFPAFGTNTSSSSMFSFGSSLPVAGQSTPQTTSSALSNSNSISTPLMFSAKSSTPSAVTTTQSMNIFGNAVATSTQSKPFSFGSQNILSPAFGAAGSNSSADTMKPTFATPTTTQSNTVNVFGNPGTNPTSTTFGGSATSQTQPNLTFGTAPAANQANSSPFGIALSNAAHTTQPSNMFGASTFGSVTSSATTPSQATMFNSGSASTVVDAQQSKSMFGSSTTPSFGTPISNAPPAFGSQNSSVPSPFGNSNPTVPSFGNPSSSTPSFGVQSNTPSFGAQATTSGFLKQNTAPSFGVQSTAPSFGTQNSTAGFGTPNNPPSFGSQNTPSFGTSNNTPSFGNQNTTMSFGSQSNTNTFGASGPFSQPNLTTAENKPPAFGSSSPFMFGNSTSKEPAKPFAAAAPFNFSQPTANASPAFGSTNTFGNGQPPAFGATTQPATGGFNFSAAPSTPTFQFSGSVPQPAPGGGMFNIGSGSSGPRSKVGAVRRRHKT